MDKQETAKKLRGQNFIEYVLKRMKGDSAFRSALRRADNPDTEYQSWEYLSGRGGCDLEKPWERLPFALISAAVARSELNMDGYLGIGKAIAACYKDDGNNSDAAKSKLRRLIACSSIEEVCSVLRSLLRLIESKGVRLKYGQLLDELIYFGEGERAKIKWASDFYGRRVEDDSVSPQVES